jgi:hypothetical protein
MEITGYEVISKNPQIIKLIKLVKSGQLKENDTYIGFSEVIADDDDIHKIIIINEHSFTMMDKRTCCDELILITKHYKYIPLIEGNTDHSKYCECNWYRMKGTCSWNYEFKNQKLIINCYSSLREDAVQYMSLNMNIKLEIVYLNNNYDYMLTNEKKYHTWGGLSGSITNEYINCKYDVSTQKYKIANSSSNSQGNNHRSDSTATNIDGLIDSLPLIKCTVIGEDDEIIKLRKENEALKQQLTSETERLQKEYQLLLEENKLLKKENKFLKKENKLLKKENIVIQEIVTEPIKKEYKNCKRCLDKHTSENELCDDCVKN